MAPRAGKNEQEVMRKNTFQLYVFAALATLAMLGFGPEPVEAAVTEAWVHRFSNVLSNSVDRALKVVRDDAGDIIVTGTTDDNLSAQDMLTIKYSGGDGSVIWQQRYNGPESGNDVPKGVAVDSSGNVVITGGDFLRQQRRWPLLYGQVRGGDWRTALGKALQRQLGLSRPGVGSRRQRQCGGHRVLSLF